MSQYTVHFTTKVRNVCSTIQFTIYMLRTVYCFVLGNESMSACSSVRSVSVQSAPSCGLPAPSCILPAPASASTPVHGCSPCPAPPPPLHKVPSWENRIYQAASSQVIFSNTFLQNNLPNDKYLKGKLPNKQFLEVN